jgi:hypothetical protein
VGVHNEAVATYKLWEEASKWNLPCWHLDLRFPSLQNCEEQISVI